MTHAARAFRISIDFSIEAMIRDLEAVVARCQLGSFVLAVYKSRSVMRLRPTRVVVGSAVPATLAWNACHSESPCAF